MKFILVFCIAMGCNSVTPGDQATRLLGGSFEITESGKMVAVVAGLPFILTPRAVEQIARGKKAVAFGGFQDRAFAAMFCPESGAYRAQLCDIGLMIDGRRLDFVGVEGGLFEQFRRLYCCVQGNGIPYRISQEGNLVIFTGRGKQLIIRPSDIDSSSRFPSRVREERSGSGCCIWDIAMHTYDINNMPVSGMRINRSPRSR